MHLKSIEKYKLNCKGDTNQIHFGSQFMAWIWFEFYLYTLKIETKSGNKRRIKRKFEKNSQNLSSFYVVLFFNDSTFYKNDFE